MPVVPFFLVCEMPITMTSFSTYLEVSVGSLEDFYFCFWLGSPGTLLSWNI